MRSRINGCHQCSNRRSLDTINKILQDTHYEYLGGYKNAYSKCRFKLKLTGHEFQTRANSILHRKGVPRELRKILREELSIKERKTILCQLGDARNVIS
jgi:hypothetical protein